MLTRPVPAPSGYRSGAERQRRARERRRRGVVSFHIEAHEHRLAEALIVSGRLTDTQALERRQIEHELAKLVEDWIHRWLQTVTRDARLPRDGVKLAP